jgi:hypothetical protein
VFALRRSPLSIATSHVFFGGDVHFNDFGDRAVFTWNEVGTFFSETAAATFQITLKADGSIILGYNGMFDDDSPPTDIVDDLFEGIVVGVTPGNIPAPTDPGTNDLSSSFSGGTTIYERWCFDTPNTCGFFDFGEAPSNLSGPTNLAFDLDQKNVVFTPIANGFAVPEPSGYTLQLTTALTIALLIASRRHRPRRAASTRR